MGKILIVEDEEFLLQALMDALTLEGFEVDLASDGVQAIEQIRKDIPALILLDILMPKKDGFAVLEEVRKNPEWRLIPVIILSNLEEDQEIKKALKLGADDYFVKSQHPIQEIVEKVKNYMKEKK